MNIALIGYGKMGQAIEKIAVERGHHIVLKISIDNLEDFTEEKLKKADVAIEFTGPESAPHNLQKCFEAGVPVVCGSTGWLHHLPEVEAAAAKANAGFLYASNFSIGVNIFFEVNKLLARLMANHAEYDVQLTEIHHTAKLDAPSGTGITLAEQVLEALPRKSSWTNQPASDPSQLYIESIRQDPAPGTHTVTYHSAIDDIAITHTAHSRTGFALGAVLAAEFMKGKHGSFTMKDVLQIG